MDRADLEQRFHYRKPSEAEVERIRCIEERAGDLAGSINRCLPDGREKDEALARLEEVVFWCRSGVKQ